jgi:hypothetical protein
LGLGCRTLIGGRDKQNRPVKPFAWWPRLIAYGAPEAADERSFEPA